MMVVVPGGAQGHIIVDECDEDREDCCPIGKIPWPDVDEGDVFDCFYASGPSNVLGL